MIYYIVNELFMDSHTHSTHMRIKVSMNNIIRIMKSNVETAAVDTVIIIQMVRICSY